MFKVVKRRNPKSTNARKVKKTFHDLPFSDGDILYLKSWGQEPKMKKTDDGWVEDTSVMVNWLYDYDVTNL